MAATTPPPLHGPSSKEKKYDRQLRLWAASGQAALEEAHILLINGSGSGVIGIETLKNLVLPGIGQYTILDPAHVTEEDLGVNFFLEESSKGGSRAEHTCKYLQELNPDVKGNFLIEPVEEFLQKPSALSPYSLIITTFPVTPEVLSKLSEHCSKNRVPLFYLRSIGFYSSFSVLLPSDFPIVDTHPDPATISDLRLLKPWPELTNLAEKKTAGFEQMSDHDHGHVPYVLVLLYYLKRWTEQHGQPPKDYKEKTTFREMVRDATRTSNPEGGEENFDEAVAAVLKALNPPTVSSTVREVFDAPECMNITKNSSSFWIIAAAISSFVKHHGVLPVPGSLPDMKAQSSDYIELQNVYKTKAREDVADVLARLQKLEKELGRTTAVDEKEVESFCRNAAHIKLIRGRPFHIASPEEKGKEFDWGDQAMNIATTLYLPDPPISLYTALLATDIFQATYSYAPGNPPSGSSDTLESSTETLNGIATRLLDSLFSATGFSLDEEQDKDIRDQMKDICGELARAGGSELHNTAALAGGLVAQEVIKAVTAQYVPIDNVGVWDGVKSRMGVLRV